MSEADARPQNRVMANGLGGVVGVSAPRPSEATPRHRRVVALVVSLLVTLAVSVPLVYQAYEVRHGPARTSVIRRPGPETRVLPTTTINTVPQIRWAGLPDSTGPSPLDGATLHGVVVFTVDATSAVRVEFWVDPGRVHRSPDWVDDAAPFTMSATPAAGSDAYDTRSLPDGEHSIEVLVTSEDGTQLRLVSRFRVANR